MDCAQRCYQPRHAEAGVLHGVIRDHVDDFLRADGRVRLELKRAWSDGTTHLLFEPLEFRFGDTSFEGDRPFDLYAPLWQDRRDVSGGFVRAVPREAPRGRRP